MNLEIPQYLQGQVTGPICSAVAFADITYMINLVFDLLL